MQYKGEEWSGIGYQLGDDQDFDSIFFLQDHDASST
jgi:hypothetical protein